MANFTYIGIGNGLIMRPLITKQLIRINTKIVLALFQYT